MKEISIKIDDELYRRASRKVGDRVKPRREEMHERGNHAQLSRVII